jgi:replicative DNA helicase
LKIELDYDAMKEAEQALLASILIDPKWITQVKLLVKPEYFSDWHKDITKCNRARLFKCMVLCEPYPNMIVLRQRMLEQNLYQDGDVNNWNNMISEMPTSCDCLLYVEVVRKYFAQRMTALGHPEIAVKELSSGKTLKGICVE